MISAIDNNATVLLRLALDAAHMRQQAIAHNIANVNTPGYQRIGVGFERQLASMTAGLPRGAMPSLAQLIELRPTVEYAGNPGGAVQLDREMTDLSETVLHQQALLKALNKHFELLGLAVNEGKR